jgi:hypothetical protein
MTSLPNANVSSVIGKAAIGPPQPAADRVGDADRRNRRGGVVGAVVAGIGLSNVAPTTVAVLMLVPLAAFEALAALPSAAMVLARARLAPGD